MRHTLLILALIVNGCQSDRASQMDTPDPDFSDMEYNGIDAWNCQIEFEFPHDKTHYVAVHVWALENGPTETQRIRFRELRRRSRRSGRISPRESPLYT